MRFLKHTLAAICLTAGLFASVSSAQSTGGISGSGHDFASSKNTWNQTQQICLPCHVPHSPKLTDANGKLLGGPLWNHTLSSAADGTFTLFQSYQTTSTITAGVTQSATASPTMVSGNVDQNTKLCLSCHDGTVALDNFVNVPYGLGGTGSTAMKSGKGTTFMTTFASFAVKGAGGDLTSTHPIGDAARWTYPTPSYMVDPSLRDAQGIMPLRPMADGGLAVGCTSCHEPHNRTGNSDFLWVNNSGAATTVDGRSISGSLLCMNCHKK